MTPEAVTVLTTMIRHRDELRIGLQKVTQELERRALAHDLSKLRPDEFEGFVEIQKVAREHVPGSDEYEASMRKSKCLDLHFSRNSHHPEFHRGVGEMGWLDIIEMVLDWRAASLTYDNGGVFRDFLPYHRKRHGFSDEQWWLVMQIVEWLGL